jgi:hypothetical protein
MRENNDIDDIKDIIENDISLSFLDNFAKEPIALEVVSSFLSLFAGFPITLRSYFSYG